MENQNQVPPQAQPTPPPISPAQPLSPEPKHKGKIWKILGIIAASVVVIFILLAWYGSNIDNQQTKINQSNTSMNTQKTIKENFDISFPSNPTVEDEQVEATDDQGPAISRTYSLSDKDGNYFSLTITKFYEDPENLPADKIEEALIAGINNLKSNPANKLISQKFGLLNNYRTLEYLLQTESEGVIFLVRSRELLVGNTYYIVKVVYQSELLTNEEVNRFIESFKFKEQQK